MVLAAIEKRQGRVTGDESLKKTWLRGTGVVGRVGQVEGELV